MTERIERRKQRGGDGKKFIAQGSKKWKNNYNPKMKPLLTRHMLPRSFIQSKDTE